MDSLQDIFQRLGKFFSKGGDEFLLPILFFFWHFPGAQEEKSAERNKFDLNYAIFFGVLIFILVAENYRGSMNMKKIQQNIRVDK